MSKAGAIPLADLLPDIGKKGFNSHSWNYPCTLRLPPDILGSSSKKEKKGDGIPTVTKGFFLVTNTAGTITWLISLHGLALPLFTGKTDKKETGLQVSLLDEWLFLPK